VIHFVNFNDFPISREQQQAMSGSPPPPPDPLSLDRLASLDKRIRRSSFKQIAGTVDDALTPPSTTSE